MSMVIGHRGACGTMPENTEASFLEAIRLGAEGIEFDVQLTRDEVPVVIHDSILDRSSSGSGLVCETDFAVIRTLDAGSWFSPSSAPAAILSLDEVFELLGPRVELNLEMKAEGAVETLVERVVETVVDHGLLDSVVFSSFRFSAVRMLRSLLPKARIGVLCRADQVEDVWERAAEVGAQNIHPPAPFVDEAMIEQAHSSGLKIWTWVANEKPDIERLYALGTDGIMSDYPDRVVEVIREARVAEIRTGSSRLDD